MPQGGSRLLLSSMPLRARDGYGHFQPLDLKLRRSGTGGLSPANGLVDLQLGRTIADGVAIGDATFTPASGSAPSSSREVGHSALYANVLTDTDFTVTPLATGAEAMWLLRSSSSPEQLDLNVGLPSGQHLHLEDQGGVTLRDAKDDIAAQILPPAAVDADGTPVALTTAVVGDQVRITVKHRELDVHYPLLVDPTITVSYGGTAGQTGKYSGWSPTSYNTSGSPFDFGTPVGVVPLRAGTVNNTTYKYARSSRGVWAYKAPGSSYVYEMDLGSVYNVLGNGAGQAEYGLFNAADDVQGASTIKGGWYRDPSVASVGTNPGIESVAVTNAARRVCTYTAGVAGGAPCPDPGIGGTYNVQQGNRAVMEHIVSKALNSSTGTEYTSAQTVALYFGDPAAPATPTATAPAGWVGAVPANLSVTAAQAGAGLGTTTLALTSGGYTTSHASPCPGNGSTSTDNYAPCVQRETFDMPLPGAMAEGANAFTIQSKSATGVASASLTGTIKLDTSAPTLALSGSLYAARDTTVSTASQLDLHAAATDGDATTAAAQRSGIASVSAALDGTAMTGGSATQSCTQEAGSCPLNVDVSLTSAQLAALPFGAHTVVVTTTDALAHRTSSSFSFTTAAPAGPADGGCNPPTVPPATPTPTHVSGHITTNITWKAACSPFITDGDVIVDAGASLTIEPGATVELDNQLREIAVRGSLSAQGTSAAPIVFTSVQGASGTGAPSQWYDLRVDGGSAVLDYADIRYGGYGSAVYAYGSVVADNGATLTVRHSRISNGGESAAILAKRGATATVTDSQLDHNGDGVSVDDASLTLMRSDIVDNRSWGIDAPAPARAGGDFFLFKNNISNNAVGGIRAQWIDCAAPLSQWPHGSRNNISGNGALSDPDGSQFRTQPCQAIHADWSDNYWGPDTYYQFRGVSPRYWYFKYAPSIHQPGYLAFRNSGLTGNDWNAGPISTASTGSEDVWTPNYSAVTMHPYNSIYISAPTFQPASMPANDPLPRGSAADGGSNPAAPNQIHGCEGDPVVCSTGEFTESYADLDAGGRGVGLLFGRTYNAQAAASSTSSGAMGWGWSYAFSDHLEIAEGSGAVTVHHANGSTVRFDRLPDGTYDAARWVRSRLSKTQSGEFKYRLPDQTLWTFNSAGVLLAVADRNDNAVTLSYGANGLSAITDAANRSITVDHNPDGTISRVTAPSGRHTDFAYDATLHLTSATDVGGKTTSFVYDDSHRLTQITDPRGGTLVNAYDNDNRVISQTDPAARSTTFAYYTDETRITGPAGDMTRETFKGTLLQSVTKGYGTASAATATIGYDADLNATSTTDPMGKDSSFTYDGDGNQLTVTDPLNRRRSYTYNTRHDITSVTAPSGRVTYFDRDSAGNLTATRRTKTETGQEQTTSYGYDIYGQPTTVTDPLGHHTTMTYDAAGSVTSTTSELGSKSTSTYDGDARLLTTTAPLGNVAGATADTAAQYTTTYDRDAYGNPNTVTDGFNKTTVMGYDPNQNLTDVTDAQNRHTHTDYNPDDEPTKVHRPDLTIVETTYDGAGRVLTQIDGRLKTTAYAYDDLGRLKTVTDPRNRATQYAYDPVGNLTSVTDASNRVVTQTYDAARQLRTRSYSTANPGNVTYDYDVDGRRITMTDGLGTTASSYDSLDRLISQTNARSETTGYGWDLAGRSVRLTHPGGDDVTRDYDNDNRLKSITDWLAHTSTFAYDANDNLTAINRANGANSTYSYDRLDQLLDITDPVAGNRAYGRNDTSQLKSTTVGTGAPKVSDYDPNGRLQTHGNDVYGFDAADNLTQTLDQAGTTAKQTFDDASQLIDSKNATTNTTLTSFNYDVLGQRQNQTAGGVLTNYEYDQAGQLTSYSGPDLAASGTTTETYAYDGDGLRQSRTVGSSTIAQGYDLSQSLPQVIKNGATRFVSGPTGPLEEITGTTVRYFHQDQIGSTVALSDQTGATVSSFDYDAYGNPKGSAPAVPTIYGYAGQITDSHTGLQYLRARYYDPSTGQFLTRDPLVAATRLAYGYTLGDPLNSSDPTGLWWGESKYNAAMGAAGSAYGAARDSAGDAYNAAKDGAVLVGNAAAGAADGYSSGISTTVLNAAGVPVDTCAAAFLAGQVTGVGASFATPGYGEFRVGILGAKAGIEVEQAVGRAGRLKSALQALWHDQRGEINLHGPKPNKPKTTASLGPDGNLDAKRFADKHGSVTGLNAEGSGIRSNTGTRKQRFADGIRRALEQLGG